MPFTDVALDTYFAPELSKLKSCDALDLSEVLAKADSWIATFLLRSIFNFQWPSMPRLLFVTLIRRAQTALVEYEAGRKELIDYASGNRDRLSVYFRALSHMELAIAATIQAYECGRKFIKKDLFLPDSDTPIARLYRISAISRHIETSTVKDGQTLHVWIAQEGLKTSDAMLTWPDFAGLVTEIAETAEGVANYSGQPPPGNLLSP